MNFTGQSKLDTAKWLKKIGHQYGIKTMNEDTLTHVVDHLHFSMNNVNIETLEKSVEYWSNSEKAINPTHVNGKFLRQCLINYKRFLNSTSNNHLEEILDRKSYRPNQVDQITKKAYDIALKDWKSAFINKDPNTFVLEIQFAALLSWCKKNGIINPDEYTREMIEREKERLNDRFLEQAKKDKDSFSAFIVANRQHQTSRIEEAAIVSIHFRQKITS